MIKGHLLWVEKSQIWFFLFRKWKINSEWEEELQKYLPFLGLICDYFFFLYFQMPSFSLNLRQGVMELKKIWGWPDNSYVTGGKFTRCQSQIYGMHWDFLYLLPLGQSSLLSGTSGLHCVSLHSHFLVSQVPYARGFKYRPVTPSWELIICPSSLVLCFQERSL